MRRITFRVRTVRLRDVEHLVSCIRLLCVVDLSSLLLCRRTFNCTARLQKVLQFMAQAAIIRHPVNGELLQGLDRSLGALDPHFIRRKMNKTIPALDKICFQSLKYTHGQIAPQMR